MFHFSVLSPIDGALKIYQSLEPLVAHNSEVLPPSNLHLSHFSNLVFVLFLNLYIFILPLHV